MTDDLLRALGREQREDLAEDQAPADPDEFEWSFDQVERDALLDAVFERVDATAAEPPTQARAEDPPNVVRLPARRRSVLIGIALAAAAAAALIWSIAPSRRDGELLATVPPYSFTRFEGGIVATRSDPGDAASAAVPELELHASSSIDWVLTPAKPISAPIGVALLAESSVGERKFVPALDVEVSEHGAVRLRGRLDQWITLTAGDWSLRLYIAAPKSLPTEAAAMSGQAGAWRTLDVRVNIVASE